MTVSQGASLIRQARRRRSSIARRFRCLLLRQSSLLDSPLAFQQCDKAIVTGLTLVLDHKFPKEVEFLHDSYIGAYSGSNQSGSKVR